MTIAQKKINQKMKPVIRFREARNGELERIVEIPKKRTPKEKPVQIEAVVLGILEDIEKSKDIENSAFLLQLLFRVLGGYFGSKASEQNDPLLKQIYEKFSSVAIFLHNKELGKKLKTSEKAQAIGKFVEALIHFGMPRKQAILAVSKWLPFGKSSVRIANEQYRKRRKLNMLASSQDFETQLFVSRYMPVYIEWFNKYKTLPTLHPASKDAFKKVYEIVRLAQKYSESRST